MLASLRLLLGGIWLLSAAQGSIAAKLPWSRLDGCTMNQCGSWQ